MTVPAVHSQADAAIAFAQEQIGKPYQWGAVGPNSFDCSGLIYAAYKFAGVSLGRTTYQQIFDGNPVKSEDDLLPGDLRFPDAGHVQLYVGGGEIIEAPTAGENVRQTTVWGPFYAGRRVATPAVGSYTTGTTETAGLNLPGTQALSSVNTFLQTLSSGRLWLRVGCIIGGALLMWWGLLILSKVDPVDAVEKASKYLG